MLDMMIEFESTEWRQAMSRLGKRMSDGQVGRVFFVHGTFAGDDPLGIVNVLTALGAPALMTEKLKHYAKKITDKTLDDLGNFTREYVTTFVKGTGYAESDCETFNWSSENNHIGRLAKVPDLVQRLAHTIKNSGLGSTDRILLIGHSHAGQLFALLTIFLGSDDKANELLNVLLKAEQDESMKVFKENLETIKAISLDIVTLGTPVRYPWGNYSKYRLLHIVNHRSDVRIDGLPTTRDGDYIQQWGTEGTDLPAITADNNSLNKELDKILDKGRPLDVKAKLSEEIRRRARKLGGEDAGLTLLVDYQDQSSSFSLPFTSIRFGKGKPNFLNTLFGHGYYTRKDRMLFTTRQIVNNLY
jgi:hypothetical protein